jgi:hypothetical protein
MPDALQTMNADNARYQAASAIGCQEPPLLPECASDLDASINEMLADSGMFTDVESSQVASAMDARCELGEGGLAGGHERAGYFSCFRVHSCFEGKMQRQTELWMRALKMDELQHEDSAPHKRKCHWRHMYSTAADMHSQRRKPPLNVAHLLALSRSSRSRISGLAYVISNQMPEATAQESLDS